MQTNRIVRLIDFPNTVEALLEPLYFAKMLNYLMVDGVEFEVDLDEVNLVLSGNMKEEYSDWSDAKVREKFLAEITRVLFKMLRARGLTNDVINKASHASAVSA